MSQTLPPLHVLLLAESPYFGGITSHLLSIVDALSNDPNIALTIATLPGRRDDNALGEALAARGRALHVLPMSGSFDQRVIQRLRTFIREQHIDLVHTHNYRATILAYRASSPSRPDGGSRLIATFHGLVPRASTRLRFWQAAERRVFKRLPLVAACSDAARQQLIDHGVSPEKTRAIHNAAMPPESIAPIDRARLSLPADRPLAVFIGRLIPSKRCDLLLRAAARAGWSVVIVGEGPARADLEFLARRVDVPAYFAGFQADP
ncbi:MAG: glycosyltransferase, partial [Candidatus Hydrogenedentes bacterium]|nr:glycosyltransferase [Candidatus Hydrogenedentota bacterium]